MAERTVTVKLKADATGYNSTVDKASKSTKGLAQDVAGVGSSFRQVGAVVAGAAVVGFLHSAINEASALQESLAKNKQVFGDSASDIEDWAKTAATSLGQSEQSAIEAAATFGNLFTALKIGQVPAADMSKKIVGLATDLASFNNVNPEDALLALRAGLVGEAEPLRKFGVNLNQASIEAKAMELGLWDGTGAIDAAAKAQGSYALIMEQTSTAQGDFERTSDGLANQQRIMAASFADAKAALGEALLPAMTMAVNVAGAMFGAFAALPDPVRNTALAIGAVMIAAKLLGPYVVQMIDGVKGLLLIHAMAPGAIMATVGSLAAMGAAAGAGIFIAGLVAGAIGVKDLTEELARAREEGESLVDFLDSKAEAEAKSAVTTDILFGSTENLSDEWNRMWGAGEMLFASILGGKNAYDELNAATEAALLVTRSHEQAITEVAMANDLNRESVSALLAEIDTEGMSYLEIKAALQSSVEAKTKATTSTDALAESTATLADGLSEAKDKAKAFTDAIWAMNGGVMSVSQASAGWEDALDKMADRTKDAEGNIRGLTDSTDLSTEAGRRNLDMLSTAAENAVKHASAVYEQTGSLEQGNAVLAAHRQSLMQAAAAAGLDAAEVRSLIGDIKDIPPNTKAAVTVSANASPGQAVVDDFVWRANQRKIQISVTGRATGTTIATGGYVTGPGTSTSDSIPAWLSDGEYVLKAAAVDKVGRSYLDRLNSGAVARYAAGGAVGHSAVTPWSAPAPSNLGTITLIVRDDSGMERLRKQIRVGYGGDVVAALGG